MSQRRTILIIDDNFFDRKAYCRYLLHDKKFTYKILEAETGKEGLKLCERELPDAILLDYMLPDFNGLEILKKLQFLFGSNSLPVVMLTGQGDEEVAVAAMKNGAADYFVKDNINSENFCAAVNYACENTRLQRQLEKSQQRFCTSIETMLDCFGIYTTERDASGRISDFVVEYANAAACANHHLTIETFIGKKFLEIPCFWGSDVFDDCCRVVETGEPLVKELLIYADPVSKQNLIKAVEIKIAKLDDGFVACWRDIVERKQREQQLRLLESVVLTTNDAVLVTEAEPIDFPGPRIVYVNPAFTRMTGYTPEEAIGQTPRILQGEKTARAPLDRIRTALQHWQPIREELINYRKDGSTFWVELSIVPVTDETGWFTHWVAVQRDITERKRAEQSLQHYTQELEELYNHAPCGYHSIDRDGKFVKINDTELQMLGYTREEIVGKNFAQLLTAESLLTFKKNFTQFKKRGWVRDLEFQMIRKDGTILPVSLSATAVKDEEENYLFSRSVVMDISDRKQIEAELRQAKARLEQRVTERTAELAAQEKLLSDFFDAAALAGIGLGIHDRQKRFLKLNQALAEINGVPLADHLNKTVSDLIPAALSSAIESRFERVISTGQPILNVEIQGETASQPGVQRDWLVNFFPTFAPDNKVGGIGTVVFDVSDRKRAEEALRQSETEFRSLSENSPIGIFRTDRQGRCTYTNPRYQLICDCTFEEALGDGWTNLVHSEDRSSIFAQWSSAVCDRQPYSGEIRYVRKDGSIRYCRVQAAPLFASSGELMGHVGTLEDITDSRAIAQMKNEFISVVSHELRTPLTSLRGSLGLLASGIFDHKAEKGKRMLEVAAQSAERLVRLVSDILDLERLESGKITLVRQSCHVSTLMQQAVEAMRSSAEQKQIQLSITPLNAEVWAASDAIIQTLTNLLSNAIKFSEPQSTVCLTAEVQDEGCVLFGIKDTGRGIPTDKLETIFGKFQQVDASDSRQKGGTGLGLAICQTIIGQHGGKIWVESVLGKGSTFFFTLPLPPVTQLDSQDLRRNRVR